MESATDIPQALRDTETIDDSLIFRVFFEFKGWNMISVLDFTVASIHSEADAPPSLR